MKIIHTDHLADGSKIDTVNGHGRTAWRRVFSNGAEIPMNVIEREETLRLVGLKKTWTPFAEDTLPPDDRPFLVRSTEIPFGAPVQMADGMFCIHIAAWGKGSQPGVWVGSVFLYHEKPDPNFHTGLLHSWAEIPS